MEQTTNQTALHDEDPRAPWRSVGDIASAMADRVALLREARATPEPTADLGARLGLAAE